MWISRRVLELQNDLHRVNEQRLLEAVARLEAETERLNKRLSDNLTIFNTAIIEAAAAKAYSDGWRLQVNTLTHQNASLLARIVPGLDVVVPRVEHDPSIEPALDFEDMGDARAANHAGGPLPAQSIPAPADRELTAGFANMFLDPNENIEGLGGTVVRSQPGA